MLPTPEAQQRLIFIKAMVLLLEQKEGEILLFMGQDKRGFVFPLLSRNASAGKGVREAILLSQCWLEDSEF